MRKILSVVLVFAAVLYNGCVLNSGNEKYSVSGTITTRDGAPLKGIYVRLGGNAIQTNINGFYKFTDIGYNNYFIEADPNNNFELKYRFEPGGHMIAVTENIIVDFIAYPK